MTFRILHRYLGYFLAGIMMIYAVSGMGLGFMLIPILGGTAMVGGIIAGMGIGLFTAAFMKDKL